MALNRLIDGLDALDRARGGADLWRASCELFAGFGADWTTAGTAPRGDPADALLHTNTPPALLRDYAAGGIHRSDPYLQLCAEGAGVVDLDVAEGLRSGDVPGGAALAGLFHDHGIRHAALFPAYGGARPGGFVLMARDAEAARQLRRPEARAAARLAAALVAARFRPGEAEGPALPVWRARPALSPREREALQWLASGLQTARIAERMGISISTVEKHVVRARAKLGARTREEALARALRRGDLDL